MEERKLFRHIEFLSNLSPKPRIFGTQQETDAATYIASQMKQWCDQVYIEPFPVETHLFSNTLLSYDKENFPTPPFTLLSYANETIQPLPFVFSEYTKEEKESFPFLYLENLSTEAMRKKEIEGKAVLLYEGLGNDYRRYRAFLAKKPGALILCHNALPVPWPISLGMPYCWRPLPIPAVSIPYFDAEKLALQQPKSVQITVQGETIQSESQNVVGIIKGKTKECILLSAHHDSVQVGEGSDDNASGVASVLEAARILSQGKKPEKTILFLSFGAEEVLSWGSFHFVASHPEIVSQIRTVVNFDSIGSPFGKHVLLVTGSPSLKRYAASHTTRFPAYFEVMTDVSPFSDHYPFNVMGVPSLWFRRIDSGITHGKYHSCQDTLHRVSIPIVQESGSCATKIIQELAYSRTMPFSEKMPADLYDRILRLHSTLCRNILFRPSTVIKGKNVSTSNLTRRSAG